MNDATTNEIRYMLQWYRELPKLIKKLEHQLVNVSPDYYRSHSFIGTSCFNQDEAEAFQQSISPEYGALAIISKEEAIKKRLRRLYKAYEATKSITHHCQIKPLECPLTAKEWHTSVAVNKINESLKREGGNGDT